LRNIPCNWLEEEVWDQLRRLFKNQMHFEKILLAANKQLQVETEKLEQIEEKFVEIDNSLTYI